MIYKEFPYNLLFHFKNYRQTFHLQLTYNWKFEIIVKLRRTYVLLTF